MSEAPQKARIGVVALLVGVAALCFFALLFSRERGVEPAGVPAPAAGTETRGEAFAFPSHLRIGTYNLHNFRDEHRFSAEGRFRSFAPKPDAEKQAVYRTILEARPDILAVQEIGGEEWLDELAEALARRGLAFPYRALLCGADSRNRMAILSRVPFSKTIEIAATKKLARGLLGVVVPVSGGGLLHVYCVHLKSKVSSDPDDPECDARRRREARFIRRLIDFRVEDEKTAEKIPASQKFTVPAALKKNPPALFALVGDFNDDPGSSPLRALEASSFASALPAKDSCGSAITYANPRREYFHAFDRIFVSPEIYGKYYVPASAKIADFPWAAAGSDHRLVYADFDFSGAARRSRQPREEKN